VRRAKVILTERELTRLLNVPPSIRLIAIESSSDPLRVDLIFDGVGTNQPPGAEAPPLPLDDTYQPRWPR
jgi:hypothetical protein